MPKQHEREWVDFNDPEVKEYEEIFRNKVCFHISGRWFMCDGPLSLPEQRDRTAVQGFYYALTDSERAEIVEAARKAVREAIREAMRDAK